MQIKRIADNIRALFFQLTNWNKEPDELKEKLLLNHVFSQVGQ